MGMQSGNWGPVNLVSSMGMQAGVELGIQPWNKAGNAVGFGN